MNSPLNLSLKQLVFLIAISALLAAGIGVLIFYLGQQSGLQIADTKRPTPSPSMPPLPKAMTATPRPKERQIFILTEDMLLENAQTSTGDDSPITVDGLQITSSAVTIDGYIDYLGYQGTVSITGQPYIDNGQLRVLLTNLSLENQPLPQLLYPTVEEQINAAFDEILMNYDIEEVLLEENQMTVTVVPW
jgi:hypothetical protein